jgi:hypothetical protein
LNLRKLTLGVDRSSDAVSISQTMDQADTPDAKWSAYVVSGAAPGMSGLDLTELDKIGKQALSDARRM